MEPILLGKFKKFKLIQLISLRIDINAMYWTTGFLYKYLFRPVGHTKKI
jgi:hypothetical protein